MSSKVSARRAGNNPSPDLDRNQRHLQAELARIDVLIQREVRRWQLADQDPTDMFRGLYVSDAQAIALIQRPLCTNWGHAIQLPPDEEAIFQTASFQASQQAKAFSAAAHCQGHILPLEHLAQVFGLGPFEMDVLLVCLAPQLDLRYERLYGYLQDDLTRKRPSINLVLDLLAESGLTRLGYLKYFAENAPLFHNHLLERTPESSANPWLGQALVVDRTVAAWLMGEYQPTPELVPHVHWQKPILEKTDALLAGPAFEVSPEWIDRLAQSPEDTNGLGQEKTHPPILVFWGPDQLAQQAAARRLAAQLNQPLLAIDLAVAVTETLSADRAVRLSLRDACLSDAIPFLEGWDTCQVESQPPLGVFEALTAFPGLLILSGKEAWQPVGMKRSRRLLTYEFPIPDYLQRSKLWRQFIEPEQASSGLNPGLQTLAGQFILSAAQIRDAVAQAKDGAHQQGIPLSQADLFAAARACSNPHLSSLARKISPRYTWADIILPPDTLALLGEIVAVVRSRALVLSEWGVGRKLVPSGGVAVLFAGPPGTGKTMSAEVIAGDLGLDLYKIDLSSIVSKYIGETEKNLEQLFTEAESSNAILFFDEADALFGKRSEVRDAHDRYANIEISYLLQRMEAYAGVTILATNLRANLDEAFTRRLQFAVDFPFPNQTDRLRIWQALFPPEVPRDPALDLALLAQKYRLAGGNIRNILVNAAYLAANDGRSVTMQHLLHGVRRELQKMGRLVDENGNNRETTA